MEEHGARVGTDDPNEPCRVLRGGEPQVVPGLSELEELEFPEPYGRLEAFQTSGGTSTLIESLRGEVRELSYKTIRYPGHCAEVRLLQDLGLFSSEPTRVGGTEVVPRDLTEQLMLDAPYGDDLCVISARGTGKSYGIVLLVARDAAKWQERYSCLITRTTYQGLTELGGVLWGSSNTFCPLLFG